MARSLSQVISLFPGGHPAVRQVPRPSSTISKGLGTATKPLSATTKGLGASEKTLETATKPFFATTKGFGRPDKPLGATEKPLEMTDKGFFKPPKPFAKPDKTLETGPKVLGITPKPFGVTAKGLETRASLPCANVSRSSPTKKAPPRSRSPHRTPASRFGKVRAPQTSIAPTIDRQLRHFLQRRSTAKRSSCSRTWGVNRRFVFRWNWART